MTTTPQPTDGAIAPSFDTLVQKLWNAAYNNGVADSDDGHSSDKKYDDAYAATKSAATAVLEANALTVTMLADAQARGDAWRDKYNADTDHIYQLRCMVRGFVNAFVASGYKPKKDSDNPGEVLLFRGIELLNRPADDRPAQLGGGVDPIRGLIAHHSQVIEDGENYAYFELSYTRRTGWMAWITDRPATGEPGTAAYAASRKLIARGQGDTADEACADALRALGKGGA